MTFKKRPFIILALFTILIIISACIGQRKADERSPLILDETNDLSDILLDSNTSIIYRDKKNNLWFANEDSGIYRCGNGKYKMFTIDHGLRSYRIISVQEDKFEQLYFDTPQGVFKFDGEVFTKLDVVTCEDCEANWKAETDDLWFRIGWDQRGPYRYDGEKMYQLTFPKNIQEEAFYKKYPNSSVNPYSIYSIYKDSKGNIWFGTAYMGIYLFDGKSLSYMYEDQLTHTQGGGDFGIRSIVEDKEGYYWICNANYKYSLLSKESRNRQLSQIEYKREIGIERQPQDDLYFYSMERDHNGNLLMFAKENGLWLNDGKILSPLFIKDGKKEISPSSMYRDHQGIFWLGTKTDGIYKYDGERFEKFELH